MFTRMIALVALVLAMHAPARAAQIDPVQPPVDVAREAELVRLRQALAREVRNAAPHDPAQEARWIELTRAEVIAAGMLIDHAQLMVVVDRNPRVQQLMIVMAAPDADWQVIGGSRVSTGQKGRFDHYVTPRGVFHNTEAILGFRAEGTLNENRIRGLGAKGMRVWDFGWHVAMKGWAEVAGKPDRTPIRLMLHATDPDKLEQRLGRTASQGCVRVPATMNRFLDQHGVLDAAYERAAVSDIRFRALLLRGREPSPLAGDTLVVVDSSEQAGLLALSSQPKVK
jgi:hypothetical protein